MLSNEIEQFFTPGVRDPQFALPCSILIANFGFEMALEFDDSGVVLVRKSPNHCTRQFLPGGLLINGMEILRDCRVGHRRTRCRQAGIGKNRHALR
jgi:hypothetical protein